QVEKQKQVQQQQAQPAPGAPAQPQTGAPPTPAGTPQAPSVGQTRTREAVLAESPRVRIETPSLIGSIALKGARIDDLSMVKYRETVDPTSPAVVLLAPSGSPQPFYAEFGWSPPSGVGLKLPSFDTVWQQQGSGTLAVGRPITLVYDNGEG